MLKFLIFAVVTTEFTKFGFVGEIEGIKVHRFSENIVALEGDDEAKIDELIVMQPFEIQATEITKDKFNEIAKTSLQYARVKERVEERYNQDVAEITKMYPLHERETWTIQLTQANKYLATGNAADAPFLKVLADAEGGTVLEFADAVIAKSEAYENFMAQRLATKRAHERLLLAEIGII